MAVIAVASISDHHLRWIGSDLVRGCVDIIVEINVAQIWKGLDDENGIMGERKEDCEVVDDDDGDVVDFDEERVGKKG